MTCPFVVREQAERLLAAGYRVFNLQCKQNFARGAIFARSTTIDSVDFIYTSTLDYKWELIELPEESLFEIFGDSFGLERITFLQNLQKLGPLFLTSVDESRDEDHKYFLIVRLASDGVYMVYLEIALSTWNCHFQALKNFFERRKK